LNISIYCRAHQIFPKIALIQIGMNYDTIDDVEKNWVKVKFVCFWVQGNGFPRTEMKIDFSIENLLKVLKLMVQIGSNTSVGKM